MVQFVIRPLEVESFTWLLFLLHSTIHSFHIVNVVNSVNMLKADLAKDTEKKLDRVFNIKFSFSDETDSQSQRAKLIGMYT